jgi:hypothetical protein
MNGGERARAICGNEREDALLGRTQNVLDTRI